MSNQPKRSFGNRLSMRVSRAKELVKHFIKLVQTQGLGKTFNRVISYTKRRYGTKDGRFWSSEETLKVQRQADIGNWPCISICVPVYNPPIEYLQALIDSVIAQSYIKWEFCLANASDDSAINSDIESLIKSYHDKRIKCISCENISIAHNTNQAVRLANGTYIGFADQDDILSPNALYEMAQAIMTTNSKVIYSDEALFTKDPLKAMVGHFKPDFSMQYLLNCNYICHFVVVEKVLFDQIQGLREQVNGAQDHDLLLRLSEQVETMYHIPKVLYYWRQSETSTSTGLDAKPYVTVSALKAIDDYLMSQNIKGKARKGTFESTYKVDYDVIGEPLVSIVIPNCDHIDDLKRCLESIYDKTTYQNFEVIIVENNSKEEKTFEFYKAAEKKWPHLKVVTFQIDGFNFSAICNFGRSKAAGDFILLLNNDTQVITENWLEEMVSLCQQPKVGMVGAMLYYPDDTIQHAGVITGLGAHAGHSHKYFPKDHSGYMFRLACVQELSAVTGACMLVKSCVYDEVGGLDEQFAVAFNDVDFCLRVRKAGFTIIFTPYAQLYHHESKSRGMDTVGEAKQRFAREQLLLRERYGESLLQDPYYNINLTLDREDFTENDILPRV